MRPERSRPWRHGRNRMLPWMLAAAVLAGGLSGAFPRASSARSPVIVPGESIGPARLGMTVSAAAAALGPSQVRSGGRRVYPRFGVMVDFDGGIAVRIATASPKYRTASGAGVGTTAAAAPRLVGDRNTVTTNSGPTTTVLYAFQGIGFVFRAGRAIETFVVDRITLGPPPARRTGTRAPGTPSGPAIVVPGGPPQPPSGTGGPASSAPSPAPPGAHPPDTQPASVALRGVTVNVDSVGGITVTGTVVNTGTVPAGPIVVGGRFTRASGDRADEQTTIQGPLAPGASAPFSLREAMVADVIIRYQVSAATASGALLAATGPRAVPASVYSAFAQRQIHIKIELGAPSAATGPPAVQAIVSIADTGAIPSQWIQEITVVVPYVANGAAGTQTAQLRPGQTQTVLVPAGATLGAPQVTAVVLGGS